MQDENLAMSSTEVRFNRGVFFFSTQPVSFVQFPCYKQGCYHTTFPSMPSQNKNLFVQYPTNEIPSVCYISHATEMITPMPIRALLLKNKAPWLSTAVVCKNGFNTGTMQVISTKYIIWNVFQKTKTLSFTLPDP